MKEQFKEALDNKDRRCTKVMIVRGENCTDHFHIVVAQLIGAVFDKMAIQMEDPSGYDYRVAIPVKGVEGVAKLYGLTVFQSEGVSFINVDEDATNEIMEAIRAEL